MRRCRICLLAWLHQRLYQFHHLIATETSKFFSQFLIANENQSVNQSINFINQATWPMSEHEWTHTHTHTNNQNYKNKKEKLQIYNERIKNNKEKLIEDKNI